MFLGMSGRAVLYKRWTFQRNQGTKTNQENKLKWKGTAPVPNSQRSQPISIWKTWRIALLRKITDIYNGNQIRHINKQCGKMNSWSFLSFLLFCWICIRLQFNAIRLLMFEGGNSFLLQPGWGYFEIISVWVPNEIKYRLQMCWLAINYWHRPHTPSKLKHIHVKLLSNN